MTNYEKWKAEYGYREPDRMTIICMNTQCENCPIRKKFGLCESNEIAIEKWLNEESEEE